MTSSPISSVAQSCLTFCNPMNRSTPGLPVHHQLPEFTQTHAHQVSDAITSWQIYGETVETVADFIFYFGGLQNHCRCDRSPEIKRRLLLERKVMTNLDSILKSRDITLSTKVHLVKAMLFPVVLYGCEIWTIKRAEHRRIDAFELWC